MTSELSVDTSTPAVVLKLDANVLHHGGLGEVAKLTMPWRAGRSTAGSTRASGTGRDRGAPVLRSTTIARDRAELEAIYRASRDTGDGVMLQEFIPGGRGGSSTATATAIRSADQPSPASRSGPIRCTPG